jgi:prepilin-type N-terminal cleavage/methylation domain-containing protein
VTRPDAAARRAGQAGLTLFELMIAMAILSVAVAAACSVGFSMIHGYRESRRSLAVERSARAAITFLSRAVRAASPGVETADIVDAVGCNPWQGIAVVNSSVGPDELKAVYASGAVVTTLKAEVNAATTTVVVADGSEFRKGDRLLVVEPGERGLLLAVEDATDNGATWDLELAKSASTACGTVLATPYPVGSLVVRAKIARFYVETIDGLPLLMMDPDDVGDAPAEPIAEGIEDLQIAVAVDNVTADGTLEEHQAAAGDDEWYYNFIGEAGPPTAIAKPWRAVRLTVTARSIAPSTSQATDSRRPDAEDRIGATAGDAYRRRTLSTTVEVRNLAGSP